VPVAVGAPPDDALHAEQTVMSSAAAAVAVDHLIPRASMATG
jgi:hypothetical protein